MRGPAVVFCAGLLLAFGCGAQRVQRRAAVGVAAEELSCSREHVAVRHSELAGLVYVAEGCGDYVVLHGMCDRRRCVFYGRDSAQATVEELGCPAEQQEIFLGVAMGESLVIAGCGKAWDFKLTWKGWVLDTPFRPSGDVR